MLFSIVIQSFNIKKVTNHIEETLPIPKTFQTSYLNNLTSKLIPLNLGNLLQHFLIYQMSFERQFWTPLTLNLNLLNNRINILITLRTNKGISFITLGSNRPDFRVINLRLLSFKLLFKTLRLHGILRLFFTV